MQGVRPRTLGTNAAPALTRRAAPQAYGVPNLLAPSPSFVIGARRKTVIEEDIAKAAHVPGPGHYKPARPVAHKEGKILTAGRDGPVPLTPSNALPGRRAARG